MRVDATCGEHTYRIEVSGGNDGYAVTVDGRTRAVDLASVPQGFASLLVDGRSYEVALASEPGATYRVFIEGQALEVVLADATQGEVPHAKRLGSGPLQLRAPMPGKIVRVLVEPGQEVAAGEPLVVIEAMKMENELKATRSGRVDRVLVREAQAVEMGAVLLVVS